MTSGENEALLAARRQGVLVVISSSAGSGSVLPRTVLRERGFVVADNLLPQKARVLAMLALTRTDDPAEILEEAGYKHEEIERLRREGIA